MRPILHSLSRFLLPTLLASLASWSVAAPTYRAQVIAAPEWAGGVEYIWYSALKANNHGTSLLSVSQYGTGSTGFYVYDKAGQFLRWVGGFDGRYGGNWCTTIDNWGDVGGHRLAGYYWVGDVQKDQGFGATIHGFPEGPYGGYFSEAYVYGLSDDGHVVGQAEGELDGRYRGYVWREGVMQEIGTFGGATSIAVAVNKNGMAVGRADLPDGSVHAFSFQQGMLQDLGTLGGANSWAMDVNNRGQIVGTAQQSDGTERAFVFDNRRMSALPTPEGASAHAGSINRQGQVIGAYRLAGQNYPFLFDGGAVYRLQDLLRDADKAIWTIARAVTINDKGWILVDANRPGELHSTVLLLKPARPA